MKKFCKMCVKQGRKRPNLVAEKGGKGLCSVHYRRKLAYRGEPQGLVPMGRAQEHLSALRDAGVTLPRMAKLSGVSARSLELILYGERESVRALTEQKILSIGISQATELKDKGKSQVASLGTVRRLQSLRRLGYSIKDLADRVGLTRAALDAILGQPDRKWVNQSTAEAVKKVFAELQATPPPETATTRRAAEVAKERGWPLPLAWDEDAIDDPSAEPHDVERRKTDWYQEYLDIKENLGITTQSQIARRMGIREEALYQRLKRLKQTEESAA
ncbi:hypothetical protein P755_gp096 [Mycobacterium phage Quink]|nr:hypothetical protein PBI_DUMBO_92 [Mycobacterium phage Dumbo]YP_008052026.1 hypothetical protein PBI_PHRUX_90 [Mycobacterium phage Phrux]YP_008052269.1 hypothetical protein M039_gp095 [Mycobacterium phage Phaux]YP_008409485.1 hypothetical protein DRDREY_92 [Mycobacterium phage DrDrey]YP_008410106.1 hypothetical protein PBI_CONTAGION_88 [Mycobacterium phage Contagion]YP_008430607.1 hypothetical protein GOKU_91 [Mycobacterium phage Goku]YP_008531172.1 hypothetical protein P755_gp096 [Mycobac